ncbi:MAG TPA: hypothetical protein VFV80_08515 [Geminicoccaceae bacterium]|nr:hypothetical protein [Geminicoccaceae bacterium]
MTRAFLAQTNFTAGELDPRLLGRTDLKSYENGAARLRNVVVDTTGGARRRPGMAYVATAPGEGRLVALETGPSQAFLLVFTEFRIDIYRDGIWRAMVAAPWSGAQLSQIVWAQQKDDLLIIHPDIPPQRLSHEGDAAWSIEEWRFEEKTDGALCAPFARFADTDVEIQASATSGAITLTTSAPHFVGQHLGVRLRIEGKQVELTNIQSTTEADALVIQTLTSTGPTKNWEELAFSEARGWPVALSFHQNRFVIGGSRDLPNALWFSRSGRFFDFDTGEGLDDEAIVFRLAANDDPAIRALVSGRSLQVFTSVGEWVVSGDPLTPINIQVEQQSRIGSPRHRQVPPVDVDGATMFVARNGREIREFLFTSVEDAYQATDLALLARHLVMDPADQAFDQGRRLFLIAMADGSLAAIAIYRNADVVAWSLQETDGRVLSVAMLDGQAMLLVARANGVFIERFDDTLLVDSGRRFSSPQPGLVWEGLDHLEGQQVAVVADEQVVEPATVTGGAIMLGAPARTVVAGLPYTHIIEPMPAVLTAGGAGGQDPPYRPVRITLRLLATQNLCIDTGGGLRDLPLHAVGEGPTDRSPAPFTGDRSVRALGWRRGAAQPPWRIEQAAPLPCTLLSATTEVKVNS